MTEPVRNTFEDAVKILEEKGFRVLSVRSGGDLFNFTQGLLVQKDARSPVQMIIEGDVPYYNEETGELVIYGKGEEPS